MATYLVLIHGDEQTWQDASPECEEKQEAVRLASRIPEASSPFSGIEIRPVKQR